MGNLHKLELGVFLPIGNNGFLMSKTAPQYPPSFAMNKQIAILAENLGFDYVFSMSKWRGFGGATHFWDSTLESITLMTGLAAVTSRIGLIATMQPVLFPPVVAAKMASTIDDISGGRFGINIVTGSFLDEYDQMGILPPDYDKKRYQYASEWMQVVKRLWTEESVTFDGEWFHLNDCRCGPKPVQKPYPFIICAGTSDEGFRFTGKEGNYSFIGGVTVAQTKQFSQRVKQIAGEYGREIKTATTLLPILDETDGAAEKQWHYIQDGADTEALINLASYFTKQGRESAKHRVEKMKRDVSFAGRMIPGSPATLANIIEELVVDGGIDSIQLLFPDYIKGLKTFHAEVMPLLQRRELVLAS
ncbi:MAG TPA: LLM class flavin-dependent oxidoreductase [Stellaceae bacterium]|nr:LLM class flavin-dependent oxidoreductase [Stellaceae bacterium]